MSQTYTVCHTIYCVIHNAVHIKLLYYLSSCHPAKSTKQLYWSEAEGLQTEETNGPHSSHCTFSCCYIVFRELQWPECRRRGEMIDTILYLIDNSASLRC